MMVLSGTSSRQDFESAPLFFCRRVAFLLARRHQKGDRTMVNMLVGAVMNLHVGKVSAFERKSAELCKQRFYYASVKLHDRVSVVRRLVIALLVMDALFWNTFRSGLYRN